jgi:hypothetical protein
MTDHASKRCSGCGETKPLSEFHRLTSAPDGRQYICKQCRSSQAKGTRTAARIRQRRYREKNRDTLREKGREYWNDPENRDRARQRYQENREEILARQRQYQDANREVVRERNRQYYWANLDVSRERVLARASELRTQVFAHYGTSCACCGRTDNLSIDHVNGDGKQHREEIFGRQGGGVEFWYWLITQNFPEGYQTLCRPCNTSKATGERCRLRHH